MELLFIVAAGVIFLAIVNNNSDSTTPDNFEAPGTVDITDNIVSADAGPSRIQQWADAIFHFEGGKPGDLNVRNNNPGNLKFAGQPGATSDARGFAVFQSMEDGFAALNRQLMKYLADFPSLTLTQFQAHYLGQTDYLSPRVTDQGNPFAYSQNVANALGVSPGDTLQSIFGGAA